jgi:hypothetical protein
LYIYDVLPVPGCPHHREGCYKRQEELAISTRRGLGHELVHAATAEIGRGATSFWNEGLAEALRDTPLIYQPADLPSTIDAEQFPYAVAGHFVRWLLEWGGMDAFLEIYGGEAFADVYGMDLEDVEQLYDAEAPAVLPPAFPCDDEPLVPEADGSFDVELGLDCDSASVTRIRHPFAPTFVAEMRLVEVTEPTTFSLLMDGGHTVLVSGCQSAAGDRVDRLGDVANETAEPAGFTVFKSGVEHEVFLPPWTYRLFVLAESEKGSVPVQLRLTAQ